jgi:hypothetical protein
MKFSRPPWRGPKLLIERNRILFTRPSTLRLRSNCRRKSSVQKNPPCGHILCLPKPKDQPQQEGLPLCCDMPGAFVKKVPGCTSKFHPCLKKGQPGMPLWILMVCHRGQAKARQALPGEGWSSGGRFSELTPPGNSGESLTYQPLVFLPVPRLPMGKNNALWSMLSESQCSASGTETLL